MARIAGVDLPRQKRIEIALTYIYGVGRSRSLEILAKSQISPDTRVEELTEQEITQIRGVLENEFRVEGDLRREVQGNIRRLVEINSYRGLRHRRGLPVRGQRTRTNARTRKGRKRTVAGRRRTEQR